MGGDRVNYLDEVGTPTADLLLVKTHLNSVISTQLAQYLTLDISKFYLNTPMERFEYARIPMMDIPDEIIAEYNLTKLVDQNDCFTSKFKKGCMDSLKPEY